MNDLSALSGQREAVRRLAALFESQRFPHALLIEGPESVGKATAARVLAKILLCRARPSPTSACGACNSCVKVDAGTHADLTEAVTEDRFFKVDQIRQLESVLRLRPVEGGPKVLIIPDAQRMNPPAQNALLKTLEEPPGESHLILTTSVLRSLLPTVVSRCQRVPFAPVPKREISALVAQRRNVPEAEAQLLAALAHGSVGRALSLELSALTETRERAIALDRALYGHTAEAALAALELAVDLAEDRPKMGETLDSLLVWLHDQIVLASGADEASLANVDKRDELATLAEERGLERALERARTVMEAKRQLDLPYNFNAQMIAEQLALALSGHSKLDIVDRP